MTAGVQCDTCRTFSPSHAPGWFFLSQIPGEEQVPSIMTKLFGNSCEPLTFCTVKCVAEFATARALVEEQPAGEEP